MKAAKSVNRLFRANAKDILKFLYHDIREYYALTSSKRIRINILASGGIDVPILTAKQRRLT